MSQRVSDIDCKQLVLGIWSNGWTSTEHDMCALPSELPVNCCFTTSRAGDGCGTAGPGGGSNRPRYSLLGGRPAITAAAPITALRMKNEL